MKKIDSQQKLYSKLAKAGDPAAFCALFREQSNTLYAGIRNAGVSHEDACAAAIKKISAIYVKSIGRNLNNSGRWVAAKCGLKKFDANVDVSAFIGNGNLRDYQKRLSAALQRCYSARLNSGSSKGKLKIKKPPVALAVSVIAAALALVFLFLSDAVISVNFDKFERGFGISFPAVKEELWRRSGLVHSVIEINAETLQQQGNTEPVSSHE